MPGPLTFDRSCPPAPVLNHSAGHKRTAGGDLQGNRKGWVRGGELSASDLAAQITPESRTTVRLGERTQGYLTKTIGLPEVTPAGRGVMLGEHGHSQEPLQSLLPNQTHGAVTRSLPSSRARWTGTDTLPRDGKPHVGLGAGQRRRGAAQTHPCSLVLLVHTLLRAQLRQGRGRDWAGATLTTLSEAWRAVLRDTLGQTILWALERATRDGWQPERMKAHLALG